jgi:uncharacterized membrane protein YhaH (DUF805 family)
MQEGEGLPNIIHVYFGWRGRISRKTYLLFGLPLQVLLLLYLYFFGEDNEWLSILIGVPLLIPAIIMNIKRAHDLGRTGWFTLVLIIPIVGIWPLVEFIFFRGTDGSNRYGEPDVW